MYSLVGFRFMVLFDITLKLVDKGFQLVLHGGEGVAHRNVGILMCRCFAVLIDHQRLARYGQAYTDLELLSLVMVFVWRFHGDVTLGDMVEKPTELLCLLLDNVGKGFGGFHMTEFDLRGYAHKLPWL